MLLCVLKAVQQQQNRTENKRDGNRIATVSLVYL